MKGLVKIKKRAILYSLIFLMLSIVLIACGGEQEVNGNDDPNDNNGNNNENEANNNEEEVEVPEIDMSEEITLRMNDWRGEETFLEEFKEPIENEFPNVTIEHIPIMPYKSSLEEQFADG